MSRKPDKRYRIFASVFYPESCPPDWAEIISSWKVPVLVSPLHDKDLNVDNTPKKPHYHIILMFEGKKSEDQVRSLISSINCVGLEKCESVRGYARYLCHLDNPEKAPYSQDGVKAFGGADYGSVINLATDKYRCIRDMCEWCDDNHVTQYAVLFNYAWSERVDWFRVLCDCGTFVVKEYLKSKRDMILDLQSKFEH